MSAQSVASAAIELSAIALGGLAFGLAYFGTLRRTVDLYVRSRGWVGPVGLTLARLAAAAILMVFAARLGAMPLLAGFLGFLAARMIALHLVRRSG